VLALEWILLTQEHDTELLGAIRLLRSLHHWLCESTGSQQAADYIMTESTSSLHFHATHSSQLHRLNSQLSPHSTYNCDNRGKETTRTTNFLCRDGKMSYLKIRWSSDPLCYWAKSRRIRKRGEWSYTEYFSSSTVTWSLLSFVAITAGLGLQLKVGNAPRKITAVEVASLERLPSNFNPKVYGPVSHVG